MSPREERHGWIYHLEGFGSETRPYLGRNVLRDFATEGKVA